MPQRSLLGSISFIVHIDDLSLLQNVLKYVDVTTLSEIISSNYSVSDMQTLLNRLLTWAGENNVQINSTKAKAMPPRLY